MHGLLAGLLTLVALAACSLPEPPRPTPQPTPVFVPRTDLRETVDPALPWPLLAPPGYKVELYARDLGEVRSVTFAPDGTPYVTIMNRKERDAGKVLALPDTNGDGRADATIVVAEGIDRAHGIVFREGRLYAAAVDTIYELIDRDGDRVAEERRPIVEKIPADGDHWARPILFDPAGNILVAVGSTCNMCQEKEPRRATILSYASGGEATSDPTGQIVARGIRSSVDMQFRPGTNELWAINHGPDHLGADQPPDQVFMVQQGAHYGWPYCIGDREPDLQAADLPEIVTPDGSPREIFCRDRVSAPALVLPPHSAPNGMAFYDGQMFPEIDGDLLIALHGSYAYLNTNGYRVVRVPIRDGKAGAPEDFIAGWTPAGATTWRGRPCDVAIAPDGSIFITDDFNGFVYRVSAVAP
ncbi:MAG: sorbosone dehydrogenase family protein [Roseiflexaceae bacterium]